MGTITAPPAAFEAVTGWMSKFDIAARTRRRIVLHGEISDRALWREADGGARCR